MNRRPQKPNDGAHRMRNRLTGIAVLLFLAVWLLMDFTGGFRLRRVRADFARLNIPMTVAELARPPVPDAGNAAVVFEEIQRQITNNPAFQKSITQVFDKSFSFKIPGQWTAKTKTGVENMLAMPATTNVLDLARQAAGKPFCRFKIEYEKGALAVVPNLGVYLNTICLICAQTLLQQRAADPDLMLAGLRISRMLMEASGLIAMWSAIRLDKMLMETVRAVDLPDESASAIIEELQKHTDPVLPARAMDVERIVIGMWIFDRMLRMDYNPFISRMFPVLGGRINRLLLRPLIKMDYADYLEDNLQLRHDLLRHDAESRGTVKTRRPWYGLVTKKFAPDCDKLSTRWREHLSLVASTQAALAGQSHSRPASNPAP